MATKDIIDSIVASLSNMPKRSEIDTATNNIDIVATQTTDGLMSKEDKLKLDQIDVNGNDYTLPVASATLGGVKTTSTVTSTSGLTACPIIDGVPYYGGSSYANATTSAAGLMSAADKTKLDGIAAGANKYTYTLPTASTTLGGVKTTSTVTSTSGLTACPIIDGVPYYKDTVYTHPTSSGNKHVPSGGSSGQILGWSAEGTAAWITPSFTGNYLPLTGGTMTGEIISTSVHSLRMIYGSYGAFFRNDGKDIYLLLTNANDQYGSWNGHRPLSVNFASGICNINGDANTVDNIHVACSNVGNTGHWAAVFQTSTQIVAIPQSSMSVGSASNSDTVDGYHVAAGSGGASGSVNTIYFQYT